MSWAVMSVVCAALVAFALVMRVVFIHEARKAFAPMLGNGDRIDGIRGDLRSIQASLDRTHGHIQRAGLCVDDQAAPGRSGQPPSGASS